MKILRKIGEKIETNIRAPHPTLLLIGIGIGISMLAVLVLTAIDGSFMVQEAAARSKGMAIGHKMG